MDPALLKERESFLKKAKAIPIVEKRPATKTIPSNDTGPAIKKNKTSANPQIFDYKTHQHAQDPTKFGVLAKIIKYMRQRHIDGDTHPLDVDEILDEMNLDIQTSLRFWLENEALPNNPKVQVIENKFAFKPKYDIRNTKGLLNLLRRHDLKGLGGIFKEDVSESLANVEKILNSLGSDIIQITRPIDKKIVLFYNDKSFDLEIDEEFTKLWRSASVEGINELKIEEYLKKQGISSITGDKKSFTPAGIKQRQTAKKKRPVKLKDNEHLTNIIEDFSSKFSKS